MYFSSPMICFLLFLLERTGAVTVAVNGSGNAAAVDTVD